MINHESLLDPSTLLRLLLIFSLLASAAASVVHHGFIDIDTPLDKRTTTSLIDGSVYDIVSLYERRFSATETTVSAIICSCPDCVLSYPSSTQTLNYSNALFQVMSDEFNVDNRTFQDGHDPMWTALDKSDDDSSNAGGGSMQFYNSSAITTENGFLKISTYQERTQWPRFDHIKKTWKQESKNFTSGMMQSWNKFCFTGGIVEVDVIFPGDPFVGGLWPAVWILGNLGRATYEPSTNNIWPWSYDTCTRDLQQAQTISACNRENHYGMLPFRGRGATEIDIVEVMSGDSNGALPSTRPPISLPYADLTLQVSRDESARCDCCCS
jgi:hypothetical protein